MRVLLAYTNECLDFLPPPPIGLAYVASATRRAGHEVRFLDLLLIKDPMAALRQAIIEFQPEVVGLSVRNIDNVVHQRLQPFMTRLDAQLRTIRAHSDAPIVLGGPAIAILGASALQRLDADFAIAGEGESVFPRLLEALRGLCSLDTVPGLCRPTDTGIDVRPQAYAAQFGPSGLEDWRTGGLDQLARVRAPRRHLAPADQGWLPARLQLLHVLGGGGAGAAQARSRGSG